MPSDWPAYTDLSGEITAAGLTAPSQARMTQMLATAVDMFQRGTGYLPFKAVSQTRTFDPPGARGGYASYPRGGGRILSLDNGLVSLTSLTIGGIAKVSGTDFFLKPNNAAASSRPYEYIEFGFPLYGEVQSISIAGTWGYSATIPDGAWWAVLYIALGLAVPTLSVALTGGKLSWSEADVSEKYGENALKVLSEGLQFARDAIQTQYKRVASFHV